MKLPQVPWVHEGDTDANSKEVFTVTAPRWGRRRLKALGLLLPLGALLMLGVLQTASLPGTGMGTAPADTESAACAQPIKVFHFALSEVDPTATSALRVRIAPEAPLARMRFAPQPQEILEDFDGSLELRFASGALRREEDVQIEVCGATLAHEVREAYWVIRESSEPLAHLVAAERFYWEWKEGGLAAVPGTRRAIRELSCAGQPLVQPYQPVTQGTPLCVTDPEALAELQRQIDRIVEERNSFLGKLKALAFGEQEYEARIAELNARMQELYLYAPYDGMVTGIAPDDLNGLAWIRLEVEESTTGDVRVAP